LSYLCRENEKYEDPIMKQSASSKRKTPAVDPEQYDRLLEESKRFVEENDFRLVSTEIPFRMLQRWQIPVGRTDNERQQIISWLQSGERGVLLQLPWHLFDYVLAMRYPSVSRESETFRMRFGQFQFLLRYIDMLYRITSMNRMRRFDLFDIDLYDDTIDRIYADLRDGTLPRINYRPFL